MVRLHAITATLDRRRCRWVPLLGLIGLLQGCVYYTQLAAGQLELWQRRQPIARVLADPDADQALQARLAQALEARQFASAQLGLPDNASYRSYVALERRFALWNVFATPAFAVEPLEHCFPIAGCVAYRGYFRQGAARAAAARLTLAGYDAQVAGIETYSTLGWFADPLISSMLGRDDDQLAALIFHELAHQRLYLPGDTAFSESYATFVEREGLRQWRAAQGRPAADDPRQQAYRQFVGLVLDTRARLRELYASDLPTAAMQRAKDAEFRRLRRDYQTLKDQAWGGRGYFDGWFAQPLNNASLLPFDLYDRWVPAFAALFAEQQGDWLRFHRAAAALAALPADERERRLRRLAAPQAKH